MKNQITRFGTALALSLVCSSVASAQGTSNIDVTIIPDDGGLTERYRITYVTEVAEAISISPNNSSYLLPAGSVSIGNADSSEVTLNTDVTLFVVSGFDRMVFQFETNVFMRFDGLGLTSSELPQLDGFLSGATVDQNTLVYTAGPSGFLSQPFTGTTFINAFFEDYAEGFCYGNQDSCVTCPCENEALFGNEGGCRNSVFRSARLENDNGDLFVEDATIETFAVLISGNTTLSTPGCLAAGGMQSAFMDGLRCVGGNVIRHGVRTTDFDGATSTPWSITPNDVSSGAPTAGQTIYVQAVYRDSLTGGCLTGQNTTNALAIRPNVIFG